MTTRSQVPFPPTQVHRDKSKYDRKNAELPVLYLCEACKKRTATDQHHIVSRGAGGDDASANLIHLCRECHTGSQGVHTLGRWTFAKRWGLEERWGVAIERGYRNNGGR